MRVLRFIVIVIVLFTTIAYSGYEAYCLNNISSIKLPSPGSIDTSKIQILVDKGFLSLSKKAFSLENAKAYIDTAELLCEKNDVEIPSLLYLLKAEYFFALGDFSNSEVEATKAMNGAEEREEDDVLARAMLFLGSYYQRTGFYKEGMDYYNSSIELSRKKDMKGIITKCYEGLADMCLKVKDTACLRENLQMMIESAIIEKDTLYIEDGYLRLGSSYLEEMRYPAKQAQHSSKDDSKLPLRYPKNMNSHFRKADSLLKRCVAVSLVSRDTSFTAFALANLGWNFYLDKMYDSSIVYYNKSLKYSIPGKKTSISANSLGNLGTIYRDLGEHDKSIDFYKRSINEAKKINDWYSLQWVYKDMSEMYLNLKDTAGAYKNFVLHKKYNDSLQVMTNSQGLTEARIRYEADSHNKEVQLLSLRLKNNRLLNYGFAGFIVLTITIGYLLFRGSQLRSKRRISEMNRQISEMTQANLRQQMNPHFIFNTLNSIQYYMYQHDKLATNNYLTKFSSLMRKVLDNSQHTSIPLRDELEALKLYLDLECLRFSDKFEYRIRVDEEIDTLLFKVPTMLIQPYVENAICHGLMPKEGQGYININLKMNNDHISCIIEDNGIGRKAAEERQKTRNDCHNGLGTRITASRLELVNALYGTSLKTIYTDLSRPDGEAEGTRVEIQIPILT